MFSHVLVALVTLNLSAVNSWAATTASPVWDQYLCSLESVFMLNNLSLWSAVLVVLFGSTTFMTLSDFNTMNHTNVFIYMFMHFSFLPVLLPVAEPHLGWHGALLDWIWAISRPLRSIQYLITSTMAADKSCLTEEQWRVGHSAVSDGGDVLLSSSSHGFLEQWSRVQQSVVHKLRLQQICSYCSPKWDG